MSDELVLEEYRALQVEAGRLQPVDLELLASEHARHVELAWPAPGGDGHHVLRSRGWVGLVPLPSGLVLRLQPKVAVGNLFRMLEYAYRLGGFELLEGAGGFATLDEMFEGLAAVLARRVLARAQRGLVRDYVERCEEQAALRGRLDLRRHAAAPWRPRLECTYRRHTADVEDNRLLASTLSFIARSGLCRRVEVQRLVRRAFHGVSAAASPAPLPPSAAAGRAYHHLNQDYRPLHALCRLFLEQVGPTHGRGDHLSLPFLVDMASLFELFVAEWLRVHLPPDLVLEAQSRLDLGDGVCFYADLVLRDRASGRALAVLDTKYKATATPSTADVAQVVAYAEAVGCRDAVLLYPRRLERGRALDVGRIHVHSLAFVLAGELESSGRLFLDTLLEGLSRRRTR